MDIFASNHYQISGERQMKYPYVVVVAAFASAVVATFGFLEVFGQHQNARSLYSTVQVAQPATSVGLNTQFQRPAVLRRAVPYAVEDVPAEEPVSYQTTPAHARMQLNQGALLAFAGLVMGAVGAFLINKQPAKQSAWTMAAVETEDESLLPTTDEILAARQEFLRLQGKGPGAQLAPGEILRPVNFPGKDQPVDLVDLYKQFDEMLGNNVRNPTVGTRVTGTVFDVDDRGASIDFGGKTIGYCPLEELALCKVKHAADVVKVGEQREFDIIAPPTSRRRAEEEFTLLSLRAIAEEIAWKRLQQYRENDVTFSIVLKGKNRGGYMMEVEDLAVPGFLPKSQATSDLATAPETADPSTFMDQVVEVKVLDLDPERKRLVVSQRAANPKIAADTFKVGTVHEGVVQNVKPYGVFVDVNGMSGLLHISQISHNRIENVDSIFKVGDKIKCMVLSQDQVQGRLALSTKRLEPTHGDMLTNPQLVYEKAEEMAERFREDIAAAEKRMQEFEAKLAEQNTVAF